MADGQIKYSVGFDIQKNGLNQLKSSLQELQKLTTKDLIRINDSDAVKAAEDFSKIRTQIQNVRVALKEAFNAKLNTTNIEKFNESLVKSKTSIDQIYQAFSAGGVAGQNAFRSLSAQVLSTNIQLKQSHNLLDKIATTLGNSLKWSLASGVVNNMSRSIEQAFGYTKALDSSLNDIRIVTGKSADEMGRFAEQANNVAKNLGTTTTDYTNAALVYAQQGLSDKEIEARTAVTLKTANVTGQSAAEVSEQLTAVWNGYKVSADEAEVYVDRLAAVAATTASDLQELSTGMSKVASAASMMGVSEQQLAAQLSTIISATKQAPQSVGTALRTVYARISDIKAGIDEEGVSLGNYSGKMKELGFNVLDMNGNLRDMGEVMEEIGNNWGKLTREQQISLAQTMAGQRQYSNLIALFNNFDEYNKALSTAQNAAGTLQQQQNIYMESTAAHLAQLKASVEDIYDSLIDNDSINKITDGLSVAANFVANFVDSLDGGMGVLKALGALGLSVFSEQIAKGINTTITNFQTAKENALQFRQALDEVKEWQGVKGLDNFSQDVLKKRQQLLQLSRLMTPQQFNETQTSLNETIEAGNRLKLLQDQKTALFAAADAVAKLGKGYKSLDDIQKDAEGQKLLLKELEKQIQSYQNVINKMEQYKKALDDLGKRSIKNGDGEQDWQDQAKDLEEAYALRDKMKNLFDTQVAEMAEKGQLDNYEQQIKDIKNEFEKMNNISFDELIRRLKSIEGPIRGLMNASKKSSEQLAKDLNNNFNYTAGSLNERTDDAARQYAAKKGKTEKNLLNTERAVNIERYAKLASGIAQVGSAIQQVQHLGSIWKNEDLSLGQKLLQTVTNLAFSLPMLAKGIQNINKFTNSFGFDLENKMMTAIQKRTSFYNEKIAEGFGSQAIKNMKEYKALSQEIGDISDQAAGKVQLFNGKLHATPTALWATGIMAAITAIGLFINYIDAATQKQIQLQQNTIEQQNKNQEQIARNRELYSSVEELNEKYKEGQITRLQLKSGIEDLIKQYDLQGDSVKELTSNYDNLTQAIREERAELAKQAVESTRSQRNAAIMEVQQQARGKVLDNRKKVGNSYVLDLGQGRNVTSQTRQALSELGAQVDSEGNLLLKTSFDQENIKELYDKVKETRKQLLSSANPDELVNDSVYQALNQWVQDMAPSMQHLTNSTKEFKQELVELQGFDLLNIFNNKNITNMDDYIEQRQKFVDSVKESFKTEQITATDEEVQSLVDNFLNSYSSDLYNKFNAAADYTEKLREHFKGANEDVEKILSLLNSDQINFLDQIQLKDITSWEDLKNIIEYLSKTDLSNLQVLSDQGVEARLESATEQYNLYSSLSQQIKSSKQKTISKTEYEKLLPEVQQFFTMSAKGVYKLTGDAKDFYDTVNNLSLEGFKKNISDLEGSNQRLQNLQNINYQDINKSAYNKENNTFDTQLVNQQLDYLTETGFDTTKIIQWKAELSDNSMAVSSLKGIAEAVKEIGDETDKFSTYLEANKDAIYQNELALGRSATSLKDLHKYLEDGTIGELAFTQAAIELDQALDIENLDPEQLSNYADHLQQIAKQSEKLSDQLETNEDAAKIVAKGIMKMNDAVEKLSKNWKDWSDYLSNSSQDSEEYHTALKQTKDAVADLLDVSSDYVDDDFIKDHLNEIAEAAKGSETAIDGLKAALVQDIVARIMLQNGIDETKQAQILSSLANLQAMIPDIEVGATIDQGGLLEACQNIINACGATVDQSNALFDALGFEANFATKEEKVTQRVPKTVTKTQVTGYTSGTASMAQPDGTTRDVPWQWPILSQYSYNDGFVEQEGIVDVPALATNGKTPIINSLTKKAGGGFNNSSSGNRGGSSGGGGKGRGGGGGGKGGGGKAAKPDTSKKDPKKPLEDQKDLYHDINIELKGIQRDLDRVQKVQERLYGKQLIDNLNKQVAILDKQKEKLKEKQKIQEQDLKNQQKILKNLGATFDKYGNINNYLSLIQEKQKAVNTLTNRANKIIEQYNASTDAEYKKKLAADIEAYNKQIQKAQEDLKDTQSKISNYDKLREEMQDLVDEIEEITQEQIEINIKKFRTEVQIRLDMGEAERDWNDFVRNVINSDDVLKDTNFDKVFEDAKQNLGDLTSYFETKQVEALANKMMQTRQQIESIDATGTSSIYGDNKAQAMQDLQNDLKELQDQMKDINGLIQDIDEAILDTVDDIDDQLDERLDAYEFVQDLIEHDLDLMQLLYGDRNYNAMDSYYKQLQKNEMDRLNLLRLQGEFWKKNYEDAIANGQTNLAKEYEKNYKNAIENINSVIEESIQTLTDKYANAINKIFDDLNKKITNGKGLDYLDQQWQLMTKNADEYLDAINAAFGVQQLESKFIDAINNTDTLKGQRALKKVMDEQLDNLRSKEKLTQYDVDRAEKLLQIEQARIALEAAQSSKTSLRLQRDSQGNYSYHYVADQQGISEAEDNYNQAVNDLYNFDKDKYKSNLQQMLAAWQEFQSEYTDIKTDMSLSDEERLERLSLLEEQYGEYINGLAQQNTDIRVNLAGSAVNDLANLYEQDAANYEAMTLEERESLVQNLLVPWGEGIQLMIDYINGEGGFLPVTQASFEDLTEVTRDYEMELAQMAAEAGVDLDMVSQGVDQVKDEFELLGMENAELIQLMYGELQAILDLRQVAQGLVTEYQNVCNAAIQAVTQIQAFIKKQQEAAASYQQTAAAYEAMIIRIQNANAALVANPLGDYTGGYDGGGGSSGGSGGGGAGGGGGGGGRSSGSGSSTSSRAPVTPAYRGAMDHTPIALLKRTGGGCFAAGTKIYMADGTYKNIEDIQINDLVIAYNDKTQKYENKKVIKTFIHFDVKKLVLIKFSNGIELKVTPGHPILTTEGWKSLDIENSLYEHGVEATLLNVNDEVLNYFENTFVKEIKYMPELDYIVYNLEVDECHTFLASGIVVHNKKVVMDTGGYTGDWGSDEGRVAILHEKQLVLNKEDTKNFLDGVMVLRQITSNLGGSIQARVSGLKSSYFNANSADEIQQKVQISASFPNVNSKRQIEEAFNDLVNLAAQRALRR